MWKYIIYNQSQEKQNKDWNWIQSFIKREYKIVISREEFYTLTAVYDSYLEHWKWNHFIWVKSRNNFKSLYEYWFIDARWIVTDFWEENLHTEYRINQKGINLMKLVGEEKQKWYRKRIIIPRYEENNIWVILLIISVLIWWFSLFVQIKNS